MGRGLVGHHVEGLALLRPGRLDLRGVADEGDRERLPRAAATAGQRERRVRRIGEPIDVADLVAPARPRLVDLDADHDAVVHRHRQRLGAAHPAEARGQDDPPAQRPAEVLAGQLGERLVGALQDPLGPDVDPGARRHLPVHHQAGPLELAEVLPGRPLPHQVRVGDQDARRPWVRPEDADRLARLDQERLVVGEGAELAHDRVEGVPAAGGAAGPAVDHERVGILGDLRIQVVHEHPQDRLLLPAAAGDLRAAGRAHGAGAGKGRGSRGRRESSSWPQCRAGGKSTRRGGASDETLRGSSASEGVRRGPRHSGTPAPKESHR